MGAREGKAACAKCGETFAPQMQIDDLILVESRLGYNYQMEGPIDHYQRVCPRCRRSLMALAQRESWKGFVPEENA